MKLQFGPLVFAAAFSLTYAVVFFFDLPLFQYFPQEGLFSWGPAIIPNVGPGMAWYGLMTDAALVALPLSFLIPDRFLDKIFRNYYWVFPCAAMLVCLYLLRNLFLIA
jgi:hypothetical protein